MYGKIIIKIESMHTGCFLNHEKYAKYIYLKIFEQVSISVHRPVYSC